ncbi:MAG: 50S ribosomal protein L6, partial [Bacteroidetes bacterium]|nr:50S ribosomal protein L6 [Bacteroidota bacterium]
MSRIGKKPINIPAGVEVKIAENNLVTVKGPKGTLSQKVDSDLKITIENGILTVSRPAETKRLL